MKWTTKDVVSWMKLVLGQDDRLQVLWQAVERGKVCGSKLNQLGPLLNFIGLEEDIRKLLMQHIQKLMFSKL